MAPRPGWFTSLCVRLLTPAAALVLLVGGFQLVVPTLVPDRGATAEERTS